MNIYFDTEFTGLHQKTTLISIGFISESGNSFYAEFTDYDKTQLDNWLQDNVIKNLNFHNKPDRFFSKIITTDTGNSVKVKGNTSFIKVKLIDWLSQFNQVDFWSDCLAYDWVLLNELIANFSNGYPELPKNLNYIPFDLATLMKLREVNPDIDREEFSKINLENVRIEKHNSLWDAKIIKRCYEQLI